MANPTQANSHSTPPLSPLYESEPSDRLKSHIRESDYGDREDVVAEEEELRHELGTLDSGLMRYPPSTSSRNQDMRTASKSGRRRRYNAFSLGLRRHRAKLHLVSAFLIVWPLTWWMTVYYLFSDHPALFPNSLKDAESTLLVVAHPDDECLFFAPAILATIRRAKNHGALLVMSSGNHYGLGDIRRTELKGSCQALGIREDRCDVMDISSVQDDPDKWWPVETISKVVTEHIDKWMIDSIITFDRGGVSGHINHRAVSAAVTQVALSMNSTRSMTTTSSPVSKKSPSLFILNSVFVLRKYSGLYDLPLSFLPFLPSLVFGPASQSRIDLAPGYDSRTEKSALESEARRSQASQSIERGLLISGWDAYRAARDAFWRHRSQMVWDRHLYMVLSRYMYFNTIERVI